MKLHQRLLRCFAPAAAALLLAPAAAHAQSAALVQTPVAANRCAAFSTGNKVADSGLTCSGGGMTVRDGTHGTIQLAPSYLLFPNSPAILNNTPGYAVYLDKGVPTSGSDFANFYFQRTANYAGGAAGFVNSSIRVLDTVSAGVTADEWALTAIVDNSATSADGSEQVGGYLQAHKRSSGKTWAATFEMYDYVANPTTSSVVEEHDLRATGLDANHQRVLGDWFGYSRDGATAEITYGLRFNTDTHTTIDNGIYLTGNYLVGINLSGASVVGGSLVLGDSHKLCVDSGACGNYLYRTGGVLYYHTSTGNAFAFTDAGQLSLGSLVSTGAISGTAITGTSLNTGSGAISAGAISGSGLTTSGNVVMPSNGKLCLNGSGCTMYLVFDSGLNQVLIKSGSTTLFSVNASGQLIVSGGYVSPTVQAGVTCSGINAATYQSSYGITTHC